MRDHLQREDQLADACIKELRVFNSIAPMNIIVGPLLLVYETQLGNKSSPLDNQRITVNIMAWIDSCAGSWCARAILTQDASLFVA